MIRAARFTENEILRDAIEDYSEQQKAAAANPNCENPSGPCYSAEVSDAIDETFALSDRRYLIVAIDRTTGHALAVGTPSMLQLIGRHVRLSGVSSRHRKSDLRQNAGLA